jgi:beta-phosphoglucomutase-like phosphatase (HAD superfamily)
VKVVCDIDGVICDPVEYVEKYIPHDWETYFSCTLEFKPIYSIIGLVCSLWRDNCKVILVSGRPESNRLLTRTWLSNHFPLYEQLMLRADDDNRPTHKIKLEWYKELKPDLIIEDDPVVVAAARSAGYTILQVHGFRSSSMGSRGDGIPFSSIFGHEEEHSDNITRT